MRQNVRNNIKSKRKHNRLGTSRLKSHLTSSQQQISNQVMGALNFFPSHRFMTCQHSLFLGTDLVQGVFSPGCGANESTELRPDIGLRSSQRYHTHWLKATYIRLSLGFTT